jgi:hypothetical protein
MYGWMRLERDFKYWNRNSEIEKDDDKLKKKKMRRRIKKKKW